MSKIIVALGSNCNQKENMKKAQTELSELFFKKMRFTECLSTEPIGLVSDMFLNCLGVADTSLTQREVEALLKQVESSCGNTREKRQSNMIMMDVDLLLYGGNKCHVADWERPYIKELMQKI